MNSLLFVGSTHRRHGTGVVKALAEENTDAALGKAHGLMNLRKPDKPRFPVTDIAWPAQPGEADICLWRTINWRRSATERMTIAHQCSLVAGTNQNLQHPHDVVSRHRKCQCRCHVRSWKLWQQALEAGHSIESHTVKHWSGFKGDTAPAGWKGWTGNTRNPSNRLKRPSGQKFVVWHTPGAPHKNETIPISRQILLAARGGYPAPNAANDIDYMNVQASGGHIRSHWVRIPRLIFPISTTF